MPQIEVTFDIDANGILHVSAKDKATGKEQSIRIEASSGLQESEIQQMVKDAESHLAEDRARKEAVEARNRADALVYEVEKNLKEHADKIDAELKTQIESNVAALREAIKSEDASAVTAATEALQQSWHQAAAAMYQSQAQQPPPAADAEPDQKNKKGPDGGAVDADFEVVN